MLKNKNLKKKGKIAYNKNKEKNGGVKSPTWEINDNWWRGD